jgi:prolyl 4-hydroxylase
MNCPVQNGEGVQVLRHAPGGENPPHLDFLAPRNAPNHPSPAALGASAHSSSIYVAEGDETIFPAV